MLRAQVTVDSFGVADSAQVTFLSFLFRMLVSFVVFLR